MDEKERGSVLWDERVRINRCEQWACDVTLLLKASENDTNYFQYTVSMRQ